MSESPYPRFLAGLRVRAESERPTLMAARLLADLGASCTVVEPPGGAPLRSQPPLVDGVGAVWWELTRGFDHRWGPMGSLQDDDADIIFVTGEAPRVGLRTIVVRITPFGPDGPWAHWRGGELIVQAASGLLSLVGDVDRAPVMIGGSPLESVAGALGATAALIALYERRKSGQAQGAVVSTQAAGAWATHPVRLLWLLERQRTKRAGVRRPFGNANRRLIFPAADGYVAVQGVLGREWPEFVEWAAEDGLDTSLRDPTLNEAASTAGVVPGGVDQAVVDRVDALIVPFFRRRSRRELYEKGQRKRIIIFPVNEPPDLLIDPHLAARGFFQSIQTNEGRSLLVAGPPVKVTRGGQPLDRPQVETPASETALAGLRVLDFSWVGAGPLTTLYLALHGAEVLRIESATRPDVLRLSPPFLNGEPNLETSGYFFPLNAGKRSVALNLATEEGRDLARRLARHCDIVVDSFTPRVMESWGLDYPALRRERPDVVVLSLSMLGATGPERDALGFGTVLQAAAGYPTVTGWPDRDPVATGTPFTDWIAPFAVLPTLLAALDHRQRTGEGCFLDASQLEATLALFRDPLLLAQCGVPATRAGNRLTVGDLDLAVPHGVYPCRGEDRWLAVACYLDADWSRLASTLSNPPLPPDATLDERRRRRTAIDDWLAEWSSGQDSEQAASFLQSVGVPAAPVRDAATVSDDAQLRHWGFGTLVDHPVAGRTPYDPPAFKLDRTRAQLAPAPLLGQHTEQVLRALLGLSEADLARLREAGALV